MTPSGDYKQKDAKVGTSQWDRHDLSHPQDAYGDDMRPHHTHLRNQGHEGANIRTRATSQVRVKMKVHSTPSRLAHWNWRETLQLPSNGQLSIPTCFTYALAPSLMRDLQAISER
jgi:hypothetical protein